MAMALGTAQAATTAAVKAKDAPTPAYGQRADVRAFAAEVAATAGLTK
ncbi:MAG: hypothetical protein ABI777_07935 [Betaproteobacteria bacterium]